MISLVAQMPPPWEPETFLGFISYALERATPSGVILRSPADALRNSSIVGWAALAAATAAAGLLLRGRRGSGWAIGLIAGASLLAVLELLVRYRGALNVFSASKTRFRETEFIEACNVLLWIPAFVLASFLVVFAGTLGLTLFRLIRRDALPEPRSDRPPG